MQVVLEISDEQLAALERMSEQRQRPREELLQDALTLYLAPERPLHPIDFFGALKDFPEEAQEFQDRMRREWVREWEPAHDPNLHG